MLPCPFGLCLRHAAVNRQRAEQRQRDHDRGRERRQEPGGDERDARLVPERREVVNARQAHDLPPVGLVVRAGVRAVGLAQPLEEPDA